MFTLLRIKWTQALIVACFDYCIQCLNWFFPVSSRSHAHLGFPECKSATSLQLLSNAEDTRPILCILIISPLSWAPAIQPQAPSWLPLICESIKPAFSQFSKHPWLLPTVPQLPSPISPFPSCPPFSNLVNYSQSGPLSLLITHRHYLIATTGWWFRKREVWAFPVWNSKSPALTVAHSHGP